MGFHVDYEKTLKQQYFEHLDGKKITAEKIDSLAEKIEANVADMHRPIAISGTANRADIHLGGPFGRKLGPDFTLASYEYVRQTVRLEAVDSITGYVSSYNINTYSGRLFCIETKRPIPFELLPEARTAATVGVLTRSQHFNGQKRFDPRALIVVKAHRLNSNKGKLKRLQVTEASAGDSVLG